VSPLPFSSLFNSLHVPSNHTQSLPVSETLAPDPNLHIQFAPSAAPDSESDSGSAPFARRVSAIPTPRLRVLADVTAPGPQRLWLETIAAMRQQPGAVVTDLQRIQDWITEGINLDFDSIPAAADHNNTLSVLRSAEAVRTRLREYIAFGAVIQLSADHPCPFGVQPLHVIIKQGKKPRLVIDLSRNLNPHLHYEYFSYSSVRDATELSTPGCWYGKLDLSNCFLSFPLHPSARPHFIFRFEGQLYQFTKMPFGLSSAPRICTMLLSVVAFRMSALTVAHLIRYLDDFLFIALTRAAMETTMQSAQQIFSDFGLVVNTEKTEGPTQQLSFLGIQLDSVAQTLSCTPERLAELRSLLTVALSEQRISLSFLASLICKLQFASSVLPGARPFVRRMLDLQHHHNRRIQARHSSRSPALRHRSDGASSASDVVTNDTSATDPFDRRTHFALQHCRVYTDTGFRADVRFWLAHLQQWNGSARWRSARSAPFRIATDASLGGFGFYLESVPAHIDTSHWPPGVNVGAGFCGVYSPAHQHLHAASSQMTWCELFAVFAALLTYRRLLRSSCVLFLCDNKSDVHILNRQATRSARLAGLLREIYSIATAENIDLYACHRSGEDNVLADFLSRPDLHQHSHIVQRWRSAHPHMAHRLSSVSVVHSNQFIHQRVLPLSTFT
jgi:hypothetical protein